MMSSLDQLIVFRCWLIGKLLIKFLTLCMKYAIMWGSNRAGSDALLYNAR
jgi:hypothetical protein